MGLITFTAGTTAVAADVNSNFSFNKQKVFLLGKGSGTTTTSGVSTLGSFNTGRTIQHGVIVFEISWVSGGTTVPYLDIVGGTSAAPFQCGVGNSNDGTAQVRGYCYTTTGGFMWTGTSGGNGDTPTVLYNGGFGVTAAADDVYVKLNKTGTSTTTYQWRAYLIADIEE